MFIRYESIVKALTPVHHGGNEKTGSTPVLRTIFIQTEYGEVPIPYISGNHLRGRIRRLVMRDFMELIGVPPETLPKRIYHSFFTGGVLEGGEEVEGVLNLELRQQIRKNIPPLSLFGCALGNQMLVGKIKVAHLIPIAQETKEFIPQHILEGIKIKPIRVFTDEAFLTRRDDLQAREEGEEAVQMKVDYEVFVPGTLFYHFFLLEYPTPIEHSCFARMINLFKQSPYIGARSAQGDGLIDFDYGVSVGEEEYISYVKQNAKVITEFIRNLAGSV
ncbi:MAG: hypothetical protein ABDH28_01900 [Brevinematia bacterium]